jgi:hypothetical protein
MRFDNNFLGRAKALLRQFAGLVRTRKFRTTTTSRSTTKVKKTRAAKNQARGRVRKAISAS